MLYFSLTTLTTTGYGDIFRSIHSPEFGQSGVGPPVILSRHHVTRLVTMELADRHR